MRSLSTESEPCKRIAATPAQMKLLEKESDRFGVSYGELMENAGRLLAGHISEMSCGSKEVLFLCGKGNNGGDCFVAARYLKKRGYSVTVLLLCGEPESGLAKLNFDRMKNIPVVRDGEEMSGLLGKSASLKVDGVFGTGFHGSLPANIRRVFDSCSIDIAVDVPSGGNCKTGFAAEGTPNVKSTLTFGCVKFGMTQYPLRGHCGEVSVADIGIPPGVYQLVGCPTEVTGPIMLPKRNPDSHKGSFGRLLTVCGSENMPGACMLSALAAARSGVGLLEVCVPEKYTAHFAARLPEAIYLPLKTKNGTYGLDSYDRIMESAKKASAVLIGCGLGVNEETKKLVKLMLMSLDCPVILDADGINCISDSIDIIREVRQDIILTPHPAEMARLCRLSTEKVQSDRLVCAAYYARCYGAVFVLKGAGTVTAYPDRSYVCTKGNPGMSRGGSGDVLSGIIAAFRAQGLPPEAGVYVHGAAGDIAAERKSVHGMLPTDIVDMLCEVFKRIE